jgi:hypothetical protein
MLKPKNSQRSGCIHIFTRQTEQFKQTLFARKLMRTVSWDRKGVPMVEFLQQETTTMSKVYCKTLKKLCRAIQNKRHGMLTSGVVLLHDTARPHTAAHSRFFVKAVVSVILLQFSKSCICAGHVSLH